MQAVFISDAHISGHDDPNLPPLLAFLDAISGTVDRLYLAGDIFNTWFAFPRAVFDEYVPLLGALHAVKRKGTELVYVTGNHDYEMGHCIARILDADVYDSEMELVMDGRRVFLAHGDLANPKDRAYRILRAVLRSWPVCALGRNLPPRWVWWIAHLLDRHTGGDRSDARFAFRQPFRDYAERKFQEGYLTVVLGHLHIPAYEETQSPDGVRTYINLGDWTEHRTFLRWDDGRLSLKQWAWPEAEERDYVPEPD